MIVFDLDGTLAPSKFPCVPEMAQALSELSEIYPFTILSGASKASICSQVTDAIFSYPNTKKENIFLLPTCGSSLWKYENAWRNVYSIEIDPKKRKEIIALCHEAMQELDLLPQKVQWILVDDRKTQITLTLLGTDAPLSEKEACDPDNRKRKRLLWYLSRELPEFEVKIAGTTSVDITQEWRNKYFGIQKLSEYLTIPLNQILFIWDGVFPGENDFPPFENGIITKRVKNHEDTLQYLQKLLQN